MALLDRYLAFGRNWFGPKDGMGFRVAKHEDLPTCDETLRRVEYVVEGGAGVADTSYVCLKDSANAYNWEAVAVPGGAYTDEQARDAIGTALTAGNNIDITVNDGANTITIDVESLTSADITDFATAVDERARDALGTALVGGDGIDITVNDGANTITIETNDVRFNVRDYGAVGDDSTDDTTAFTNAIADLVVAGGVLYVPAGRYKLTNELAITLTSNTTPIVIAGDGKYASTLRFTGAGVAGGIVYGSTLATDYLHPTIHIHDIGIVTSKQNAGTAVTLTWDDDISSDETWLLENVVIDKDITRVSDGGADYGYWSTGLHVKDGRNGEIRNCVIKGTQVYSPVSSYGVLLAEECTAVEITNSEISEFTAGIYSNDVTEGIYLFSNDILYCDFGLLVEAPVGEPQMTVIGNSFNCRKGGVWLENVIGSVVSGNLCYSWDGFGTDQHWTGIRVSGANSRQANITDNNVYREPNTTGVTTVGIQVYEGIDVNVTNNHVYAYSTHPLSIGIAVESGATGTRLRSNQITEATTPVSDAGTSTQIEYWDDAGPKFAGAANQEVTVSGSAAAFLKMEDTGGGANAKYLAIVSDGGGWDVRQLNDDGSLKAVVLAITSGNVTTLSGLAGTGTRTLNATATGELSPSALTATVVKSASGVLSAATAGADYYNPGGTDVALADGGTGASLADPNADRILFWDDSAGAMTWLTPGTNLTVTGTTLDATDTNTTTPGGADTQVQFNDGGVMAGDSALLWDKTTNTLTLAAAASNVSLDLSTNDQYADMRVIRNSRFGGDKMLYLGYASGVGGGVYLCGHTSIVGAVLSSGVYLYDSSDSTKALTFNMAGITTGNTRTVTVPDANGTMAFTSGNQSLLSTGTQGVGYATGAGGAVTQLTSKATGVTLDKITGQITTHNAALNAATEVTFTVTNSTVAATDVPMVAIASGGTQGAYAVVVSRVAAGSFGVTLTNLSAGSLSEAIVINFVVIKGVSA